MNHMMKKLLITSLVLLVSLTAVALAAETQPVKLANIFTSGMVLQRDETAPIWGTGAPGSQIKVEVKGQSVQSAVGRDGTWRAELTPEPAGGPFTLTVSSPDSEPVVLSDVYFGDVWMLTGQSNMFNQLQGLREKSQVTPYYPTPLWRDDPSNDFDDVRFFIVKTSKTAEPVQDLEVEDPWTRWESKKLGHMSVVGYYFTRALNNFFDANGMSDVPIGIIKACRGATAIEEWMSPEALASLGEPVIPGRKKLLLSGYYNGMIGPLKDYAIKGVLWYQGESNSRPIERVEQYSLLKKTLVESWREQWGIDFPFYWVQLAPYRKFSTIPSDEEWAWFRESQTESLALTTNTGMACIIDIGFQKNIHPPYKDLVGQRLARMALANTYGFDLVSRGPTVTDVAISGSSVTITFDNVAEGLHTQAVDAQLDAEEIADGFEPVSVPADELAGFALSGADQTFYWATEAEIISPNQVRISNVADVPNPVAVRYAWQSFPRCNLFNSEGLPAEPFRTDTFAFESSSGAVSKVKP